MRYTTDDLRAAADAGVIPSAQLDPLLEFLAGRTPSAEPSSGPKFDAVHLMWYAGALIVIGAMGLFSTLAFSQMGGQALTMTAIAYAVAFTWVGHYLWIAKGLSTPGGLLIAVAVSMVPLAVYGIQDYYGLWTKFGRPDQYQDYYTVIKGSWLFMEIATIVAAAIALYFYRFPFIVMIAAVALWFMSMDIVPWIAGKPYAEWELKRQISIWFGLGIIVAAVIVNARQRSGDFAFWLYLFGVITFWGAISATSGGTPLQKAIYCAMNVGFLFIAVFLGRRIFAVFGTIGISMYLGDLADKVFKDSLLFPFALSLIGIAIIALGLYYHRHQDAARAWFDGILPTPLKRLRPANALA
jgi:hypothetical protein